MICRARRWRTRKSFSTARRSIAGEGGEEPIDYWAVRFIPTMAALGALVGCPLT